MAFEMQQVIGAGNVQELICQTIDLGCHVEEIKEIRKTVIVDRCKVVFDKIIIDGRLRKDIMFKQANAGFPIPGTVQGCSGVTATITGNIMDVDVDIAFTALIPVPGAQPGDNCVILQAFVEGELEEPANLQHSGSFTTLIDKSIIFICAKVVRSVISNGMAAAPSAIAGRMTTVNGNGTVPDAMLCPQRRTTGFHPTGSIPLAQPGPVAGSWVGPTLIFGGVLNPGIPGAFPPSNTVFTGSFSQLQVTGMQPMITDGTTTDVTAAGGATVM